MSTRTQREYLAAQLASVNTELQTLTPDDAVERRSLTSLRRRLEAEIAALDGSVDKGANVVLFFEGGPVVGSVGIDAGFVSPALLHYHGLVTRLATLRAGAKALGNARMIVTGVVYGSFGVELQEAQQSSVESPLSDAVEDTARLLEIVARREQDIDAAFDGLDKSAHASLRRFLTTMQKHKARVRLVSERSELSLSHSEIRIALERVKSIHVSEEIGVRLHGTFGGALGYSRAFEHRTDTGDLISGSIAEELDVGGLNDFFEKSCYITVTVITRERDGRRSVSYRMTGPPLPDEEGQPV